MIKQDPSEISKMKEALGEIDNSFDPTAGAGMNIDDLMNKLLAENQKNQGQTQNPGNNPTDEGNQ